MAGNQIDFQGLVNSLSSGTQYMVSVADQQMKEKARSDLLNMQARLDLKANDFMNSLKTSTDYENWNQRYDTWIKEQSDLLQKSSKNQYTAKAANEMLQNYAVNMRKNLDSMILEGAKNSILMQNDDTVSLIQQNKGIKPQEKMDSIISIMDTELTNNYRDKANYEARIKSEATKIYNDYYADLGSQLIMNAIETGEGINSILAKIDSDDFSINLKSLNNESVSKEDYDNGKASYTDITHSIDRTAIKKTAKKTVEQNYNAYIKQIQTQNDSHFSEVFGKVMSPALTPMQMLSECQKAVYDINANYGGSKLSSDDRKKWIECFTKTAEQIGKGGSGKETLPKFELQFKYAPESALQSVANGEIADTYTAAQIVHKEQEELFFSRDWAETQNMTALEKAQYWQNNWDKLPFTKLLDSTVLLKRFKEDPRFSTIRNKVDQFKMDFKKDPTRYSGDALQQIDVFICDFVASTGKEVTEAQMKQWNDILNGVLISKSPLAKGSDEDKLEATKTTDYVFTDDRTNTEYIPKSRQKEFKDLQNIVINKLQKEYGIEVTFKNFEKTYNDSTNNMIFADEKGNEYTYEVIKDKHKKIVKFYKNGEELEKPKDTVKTAKKQERDKSKELKNNSDTVKNRYTEKAKYMTDSDYDELSKKLIDKGITYATVDFLKGADLETRASLLEEANLSK